MTEPLHDTHNAEIPVYQTEEKPEVACKKCSTIFVAIGLTVAAALVIRALRPKPTPQNKLAGILEQIEGHLRKKAKPAGEKIGRLLSSGTDIFEDRLHKGESHLDNLIDKARRQIQKLIP